MKATANKVNTPTNLKGMAKHTYNRVMSAMVEDSDPAMLHTFAALTEGAKAIALQSGNFSNLYVRGINKSMTAEEAANELTGHAAALVSRKLRKIDMVCAAAFLAEYISRQRKEAEQPEPTNPDNTPSTMDAKDIKDIEAITGAKVIAATKENSVFNSDFVLLNDNGVIHQAFVVRDINGKMCVDVMPGEYDSPAAALAYLNMSNKELAQNIAFIEEDSPAPPRIFGTDTRYNLPP